MDTLGIYNHVSVHAFVPKCVCALFHRINTQEMSLFIPKDMDWVQADSESDSDSENRRENWPVLDGHMTHASVMAAGNRTRAQGAESDTLPEWIVHSCFWFGSESVRTWSHTLQSCWHFLLSILVAILFWFSLLVASLVSFSFSF